MSLQAAAASLNPQEQRDIREKQLLAHRSAAFMRTHETELSIESESQLTARLLGGESAADTAAPITAVATLACCSRHTPSSVLVARIRCSSHHGDLASEDLKPGCAVTRGEFL